MPQQHWRQLILSAGERMLSAWRPKAAARARAHARHRAAPRRTARTHTALAAVPPSRQLRTGIGGRHGASVRCAQNL